MFSIRFFIANPKAARSSINMIVLIDGQRYKRGIGVSVETNHWNVEKQKADQGAKYRDGGAVNFKVDEWRRAAERLCRNIVEGKISPANAAHFAELINCEMNGTPYTQHITQTSFFTEYFEHVFLPRFCETKTQLRQQRFLVALHKVQAFELKTNRQYKFDDLDLLFYRGFLGYMNDLKHSVNYFGSVVKIIKQVMREAQDVDKMHVNTYALSPSFKAPSCDTDTVYLSVDELNLIIATPIDDAFIDKFYPRSVSFGRESLKRSYTIVKNRFLIGAFTGLRMSDFNKLSAENIKDGKITIITKKTNQRVVIPIHPVVQEIIDDGFDFTESLSDQKTRMYIKHICKYAGLTEIVEVRDSSDRNITRRLPKWELVSSHTARRSFATNAFKAGVPTIAIMKFTGHTSERTFMKYIRISNEENADMLSGHAFFK